MVKKKILVFLFLDYGSNLKYLINNSRDYKFSNQDKPCNLQ